MMIYKLHMMKSTIDDDFETMKEENGWSFGRNGWSVYTGK